MARVLVVDDDPMICESLDFFLSNDGHDVDTATNGSAALDNLRARPADIAIVDLFMPVKEGFETIRELKRRFPKTCVIAMSGGSRYSGTDWLNMAVKLGADQALQKPMESERLRESIAQCLAR